MVQRTNGEFGIFDVNEQRNFNLACANHHNIDMFLSKCPKNLARHASVRFHAHANNRDFGAVVVIVDFLHTALESCEHIFCEFKLGFGNRKIQISLAVIIRLSAQSYLR